MSLLYCILGCSERTQSILLDAIRRIGSVYNSSLQCGGVEITPFECGHVKEVPD